MGWQCPISNSHMTMKLYENLKIKQKNKLRRAYPVETLNTQFKNTSVYSQKKMNLMVHTIILHKCNFASANYHKLVAYLISNSSYYRQNNGRPVAYNSQWFMTYQSNTSGNSTTLKARNAYGNRLSDKPITDQYIRHFWATTLAVNRDIQKVFWLQKTAVTLFSFHTLEFPVFEHQPIASVCIQYHMHYKELLVQIKSICIRAGKNRV